MVFDRSSSMDSVLLQKSVTSLFSDRFSSMGSESHFRFDRSLLSDLQSVEGGAEPINLYFTRPARRRASGFNTILLGLGFFLGRKHSIAYGYPRSYTSTLLMRYKMFLRLYRMLFWLRSHNIHYLPPYVILLFYRLYRLFSGYFLYAMKKVYRGVEYGGYMNKRLSYSLINSNCALIASSALQFFGNADRLSTFLVRDRFLHSLENSSKDNFSIFCSRRFLLASFASVMPFSNSFDDNIFSFSLFQSRLSDFFIDSFALKNIISSVVLTNSNFTRWSNYVSRYPVVKGINYYVNRRLSSLRVFKKLVRYRSSAGFTRNLTGFFHLNTCLSRFYRTRKNNPYNFEFSVFNLFSNRSRAGMYLSSRIYGLGSIKLWRANKVYSYVSFGHVNRPNINIKSFRVPVFVYSRFFANQFFWKYYQRYHLFRTRLYFSFLRRLAFISMYRFVKFTKLRWKLRLNRFLDTRRRYRRSIRYLKRNYRYILSDYRNMSANRYNFAIFPLVYSKLWKTRYFFSSLDVLPLRIARACRFLPLLSRVKAGEYRSLFYKCKYKSRFYLRLRRYSNRVRKRFLRRYVYTKQLSLRGL